MIIPGCHTIVRGEGEGIALVTSQPINFLSMLDPRTGTITDQKHELHGKSLTGAVLVFPYAIGSSVGAYAIYSLREYATAPSAIVCAKADITTASGCAVAKIPLVDLPESTPLSSIIQGSLARVDADSGRVVVKV